jgi:hypothetical protein
VRTGVHPKAALGWTRAAGTYERGRAGYPEAAVAAILAALDETPREQVLAEVAHLLDSEPATRSRDDVALPYVTELFTTFRRPAPTSPPSCADRSSAVPSGLVPSSGRGTA